MKIPSLIIAGDSTQWVDAPLQDDLGAAIVAPDYALSYAFRGPGAPVDLSGTPQGSGWAFSLAPSISAALNATSLDAKWFWQAYATKTGVRLTAGSGSLIVKPNLQAITSTTFDQSSPAEKVLKAIETEISARLNGGATVEYTIGSRSLKKEPLAALMTLRSSYRLIVARERTAQAKANGQGNPQRLGVRFR